MMFKYIKLSLILLMSIGMLSGCVPAPKVEKPKINTKNIIYVIYYNRKYPANYPFNLHKNQKFYFDKKHKILWFYDEEKDRLNRKFFWQNGPANYKGTLKSTNFENEGNLNDFRKNFVEVKNPFELEKYGIYLLTFSHANKGEYEWIVSYYYIKHYKNLTKKEAIKSLSAVKGLNIPTDYIYHYASYVEDDPSILKKLFKKNLQYDNKKIEKLIEETYNEGYIDSSI